MCPEWLETCSFSVMAKQDTLKLMAPWAEVKEKMKESNIELTDEDLVYEPGQEEDLLKHLERKMGRSRGEIRSWIESLSSNKGKAS